MDVRVNGQTVLSRAKALPAGSLAKAESTLRANKDGYDTYGVTLESGSDAVVLSRSAKALKAGDRVEIDGKLATVKFVENEANTLKEGALAPFKARWGRIALGVGGVGTGGVAAVMALALSPTIAGLALGFGVFAVIGAAATAALLAAGGALKGGLTRPADQVSDAL